MEIKRAIDLKNLPKEFRDTIKNICQDPTDANLIQLAAELGIKHLFPEDRVADILRIWLKITGFIKPKESGDNEIPIISWIDLEAEGFLDGNPNQEFKGSDISDMLEIRLATISDMYLKTSALLDKVKEKVKSEQPSD